MPTHPQLQQLEAEATIDPRQRLYCPHKDCSEPLLRPEHDTDLPRDQVATCPACHRGFCPHCMVPGWHEVGGAVGSTASSTLTCFRVRGCALVPHALTSTQPHTLVYVRRGGLSLHQMPAAVSIAQTLQALCSVHAFLCPVATTRALGPGSDDVMSEFSSTCHPRP